MSRLPRTSRGKRPHFFEEKSIDQLVSMFLALMSETWVLKERLYLLERLASEKGLLSAGELDAFNLSDQDKETLASRRREFVQEIFSSLQIDHEDTATRQSIIDELTQSMRS